MTTFESAAVVNRDLAVMLRGWDALQRLDQHHEVSLGPLLSDGPHYGCSRFAATALRAAVTGRAPDTHAYRLVCQDARSWITAIERAESTFRSWRGDAP